MESSLQWKGLALTRGMDSSLIIKWEEAEYADINNAKWIKMRAGVYRSFILNYSLGGSGVLWLLLPYKGQIK